MSNTIFPALAGLAMTVSRIPMAKTIVKETPSGREYRGRLMLYPRYEYQLAFDILGDRGGAWYDGFRTLLGFFNARYGSFDSFLFDDPDDDAVTNALFATGDAATKTFQLNRDLGGFTEPVYDIKGGAQIYVAGVLKTLGTDYTISNSGAVTFTAAPAALAALTWSGGYYWRVRFKDDTAQFDKFMYQLWQLKQLSLLTVKP